LLNESFPFTSLHTGPESFAIKGVRLLMKVMNLAAGFVCIWTVIVATLIPRIPPFLGYFLCRLGHDWEMLGDPCQLHGDLLNIRNLVSFGLIDMKTLFRILNGCICFAVYIPGVFNANLMATYEVIPNLIFQKDCLAQFQATIANGSFRDCRKTMGKYRQLLLLNIMFNEIYRRDFFGMVMASVIMIIIPTGYFLVTSYHVNQIVLILLGLLTIIEYVLIATIFIMASKVWNGSVKFRNAWRSNTRLTCRPLSRKYEVSLQHLKIKVGSSNFVEANTPFVVLSLCVEQTITLVLLKKG
jgi:hypothetical protein